MSSLRDQLVKAKLASRADLRRVNHEKAAERRQQQGHREARATLESREEEQRRAAEVETLRRRAEERCLRQAEDEARARQQQADAILRHHRIDSRPGPQRFWHRTLDGRFLHRLDLPERMAMELRSGHLAVGAIPNLADTDYVLVPAAIAGRVHTICPDRIVHWNQVPPDPADPAEQLLDWRTGQAGL